MPHFDPTLLNILYKEVEWEKLRKTLKIKG